MLVGQAGLRGRSGATGCIRHICQLCVKERRCSIPTIELEMDGLRLFLRAEEPISRVIEGCVHRETRLCISDDFPRCTWVPGDLQKHSKTNNDRPSLADILG